MPKPSFAPGPWILNVEDGRAEVCVDGERLTDPYIDDEDARLIAAAPELLEALRRAESFITNGVELGFIRVPSMPDPVAGEALGIIRAAIDKAEGK